MRKILFAVAVLFALVSCAGKKDFSEQAVCTALAKMTEKDQKYRFLLMEESISPQEKDSLLALQQKLDKKNVEELIDIIAHRGWPDMRKLPCEKGVPVLIFRHAGEEYFDTIRSIIDTQYQNGNMAKGDYMFIDNHLAGRPMFQIEEVTTEKDTLRKP